MINRLWMRVFQGWSWLGLVVGLGGLFVWLGGCTTSEVPENERFSTQKRALVACKVVAGGCDEVLKKDSRGSITLKNVSKPGKTLCIPKGTYIGMSLTKVTGAKGKPVKFINCGGKVIFDSRSKWNVGINANESRYIHITGTGSKDTYGIVQTGANIHGVNFDSGSSDIEVDHMEIYKNGYLGIAARTYPRCGGLYKRGSFTQYNTHFHHNYIHDVGGEGFYIGTSHYQDKGFGYPPHKCPKEHWLQPDVVGVHVHHNRLERIALDGIQIGAGIKDVKVHHNIIKIFATKGSYGHTNGIGLNPGTVASVYQNWIEASTSHTSTNGVVIYGHGVDNATTVVRNNVIINVRTPISFLDKEDTKNQKYLFYNNTIYNAAKSPIYVHCSSRVRLTFTNNLFIKNLEDVKTKYWYLYGFGRGCFDQKAFFADNIYEQTNVASLKFANVSKYDFHLKPGSPAIGKGKDLSAVVKVDYEGTKRTKPFDMGAYAFKKPGTPEPKREPSPEVTVPLEPVQESPGAEPAKEPIKDTPKPPEPSPGETTGSIEKVVDAQSQKEKPGSPEPVQDAGSPEPSQEAPITEAVNNDTSSPEQSSGETSVSNEASKTPSDLVEKADNASGTEQQVTDSAKSSGCDCSIRTSEERHSTGLSWLLMGFSLLFFHRRTS